MIIMSILKSKLGQLGLVTLIGFGAGAYFHHKLEHPQETRVSIAHDTIEVIIDRPVLTERIVDRIITDPKQQEAIAKLIKENNDLKLKVTQLTSTVARNQTSGGTDHDKLSPGTITPNQKGIPRSQDRPTDPSSITTGIPPYDPSYHFKDWQLTADYSALKFSYNLDQTYIVTTTTGKDSKGNPVGIVRLFQDTPKGLVPIQAKTIVIQADENLPRWFVSPRIQGGLGIDQDKVKSGFVGLQLLKHGKTTDPKDIRWSVATVGVKLDVNGIEPVLLPLSFNLGSLPHQPFSNIWLSPSVNLNKKIGLTLTATF